MGPDVNLEELPPFFVVFPAPFGPLINEMVGSRVAMVYRGSRARVCRIHETGVVCKRLPFGQMVKNLHELRAEIEVGRRPGFFVA